MEPQYRHDTAAPHNNSVNDAARGAATAMQKYFGPLRNSDIDTFASDAFAHETHNLPRAYVGRNKFLMATIDFLITKDDDWYTRYVLPWLYTEELHVKWNIWRFNRTMMDYEPEQGVPRYVSYESESRSDSLVRRGLAFIIEHGFYKTELGRQHYLMNLKQIVEAVHETVYFGVMHELLAAPNFYQQWQAKHGNRPSIVTNDVVGALAEERWRFACVQKDIKGLFILDAEIKDRMRRVGIEPTAWIFPSKMAIYASMVPEYFNEFIRGGEKATNALENGAKRFDSFRGCQVFETRPFDTDFMSEGSIEPLMREREIGEYAVLPAHFHDDEEFGRTFDAAQPANPPAEVVALASKYGILPAAGATDVAPRRNEQAVQIFDMAQDKFTTIKHGDAMKHAFVGGNGAASVVEQLCKHMGYRATLGQLRSYGMTIADFALPNGGARVDAAGAPIANNVASNTIVSLEAGSSFRELVDALYSDANNRKLILPHKLLLFRPRMTYRMGTAILLKGGEELGQTLHGHHDFQLTDDVIHKTHIGHYTFYSKSVVREPKNMYIAEDVYCAGYNGGENTKFISENDVDSAFSSAVNHRSRSIICVPVPVDTSTPACMPITGDFEAHGMSMHSDEGDTVYASSTGQVLKDLVGEYMGALDRSEDQQDVVNGVCFRGAERTQKEHGGEFFDTQQNTGHWGPSVYDGCASVRQGLYAHLRPPGSFTSIGY